MTTLRTRVLFGYGLIVIVLFCGGFVTARIQHNHLFDAVDSRLQRVADSPKFIEKRIDPDRVSKPAGAGLSDMYLGVIDSSSELSTLSTPDDDSEFIPDFSTLRTGNEPRTVRVVAGSASRARAVLVTVNPDVSAVVAIPLSSTDRSIHRLNATLLIVGLGVLATITLLTVWILVLGIKPIRALSLAAGKVAAGQSPDVSTVPTASREASELKEAINGLIASTRENEEKMRRFVADASHELRTPLTTLRGYASLLTADSRRDLAFINDSLSRMNEESLRMSRLVDDLLTLTRSESAAPIEPFQFDIVSLINDIASDLRVVQPERAIEVASPAELRVVADRGLIAQAILALGSNALRHTPTAASITLVLSKTDSTWRVEVSDTGAGIDESHLPLLFDRFYRVESTGAQAGSGLGLAIVASIVERHGGRVGVNSVIGTGSSFWFEIPFARADASTTSGGAVG